MRMKKEQAEKVYIKKRSDNFTPFFLLNYAASNDYMIYRSSIVFCRTDFR